MKIVKFIPIIFLNKCATICKVPKKVLNHFHHQSTINYIQLSLSWSLCFGHQYLWSKPPSSAPDTCWATHGSLQCERQLLSSLSMWRAFVWIYFHRIWQGVHWNLMQWMFKCMLVRLAPTSLDREQSKRVVYGKMWRYVIVSKHFLCLKDMHLLENM
jgi:hypothetical protein